MPANDSTTFKRCTKCGTEYPATTEYFCAEKRNKDGLQSWCRACKRALDRKLRVEHPEQKRAKNREWYAEHREQRRAYSRKWHDDHREQSRAASLKWKAEHPEQNRAAKSKWAAEHTELKRVNEHNRRARKIAAEGTHTAVDVEAQYQRQKGRCYYCNCKMTKTPKKPNSATEEHVVPLDKGGRNDPSNLVIACAHCNFSKGNKLLHEWAQGGRLL